MKNFCLKGHDKRTECYFLDRILFTVKSQKSVNRKFEFEVLSSNLLLRRTVPVEQE